MKMIRLFIVGFSLVLIISACQSTPNHMQEPVNSTESGSYAAGDKDTGTTRFHTLHTMQPTGMDTTGEQTGRMNNTPGNNNTNNAQNHDTVVHKTGNQ